MTMENRAMYVEKFHPARGACRRLAGLTLTELLVTTAILAIIVGLTGSMLSPHWYRT